MGAAENTLPRVLTIAGSDSGGGAGIQADLKTILAHRCYGMSAITALTSQNTLGVRGIYKVDPAFVKDQILAVLDDIGADAIKLGMLSNSSVIIAVAEALEAYRDIPLIVDPVMVAKDGTALLDTEALRAFKIHICPLATLLTPNVPEAELLSGERIARLEDAEHAVQSMLTLGAEGVLLKGGHLKHPEVVDLFFDGERVHRFTHPRLDTANTHGTGCTLSAAIAAQVAQGLAPAQAVERAIDYVHRAIATAPALGGGHGPLNHGHILG